MGTEHLEIVQLIRVLPQVLGQRMRVGAVHDHFTQRVRIFFTDFLEGLRAILVRQYVDFGLCVVKNGSDGLSVGFGVFDVD